MKNSVALIVNQPNPENFADLQSAIEEGLVEHPYNTLAQFARAVQQWPQHPANLPARKLNTTDQVEAFESVLLVNFNRSAGFATRGIKLEVLQAHPVSEMLLSEVRQHDPALIACFGLEPYMVLMQGLGRCQMKDPIEEGSARQYVSSMNERGQVMANFGYFRENDERINLIYTDFLRLLDWCAKKD